MTNTGVVFGQATTKTIKIDTNLAGKEYTFVNYDPASAEIVNAAADASAIPFILTQGADGSVTEAIGTIAIDGNTKVICGGNIVQGNLLTATTDGKAIATTTDTDFFGAIALGNGALNDVIEVKVVQGTVSA